MNELIFYQVDMQNDFMNKEDGRLQVPNAENIKTNIRTLSSIAEKKNIRRIKSMDRHFADDSELTRNGGPFPDHCMDWSYNQKNKEGNYGLDFIPELQANGSYILEHKIAEGSNYRNYSEKELEDIANGNKDITIEKQHNDVFTNPAAEKVLAKMDVKEVIAYGVATEYCLLTAILGMQKRRIQTYVVTDAIEGITSTGAIEALRTMEEAGAKFIKTKDVQRIYKLYGGN